MDFTHYTHSTLLLLSLKAQKNTAIYSLTNNVQTDKTVKKTNTSVTNPQNLN